MTQFIPVVFPQPGSDTAAWARSMLVQLDLLQRQLVNLASNGTNGGTGGGTGVAVTPVTTPTGEVVINPDGEFIDGLGRVVVSSEGITVYDLSGFRVIEGPNVVINTDHLADNAVATAKLANGAITSVKVGTDAIEAPHIKAGAIIAGKLGVNSIIANDGVIGNAAIANAQIIELHANKISAGDIEAERMEANIVSAISGKFATLSALVASLGVVRILPGGALLTQTAVAEMSGDGVWIAENKFRAGNPAGSYIRYDGTKLTLRGNVEILNSSGSIIMAAGGNIPTLAALEATVADLNVVTIENSDKLTDLADDNLLVPLEKQRIRQQWDQIAAEYGDIASTATSLAVGYSAYVTVLQALANYLNGGSTWTSGYPLFINDANMSNTHAISGALFRDRFRDFYTQRQILLNDLSSAAAAKGARVGVNLFKPDGSPVSNSDLVATWNTINSGNISTFFQTAAIGTAQIGTAAITSALIANLAVDRSKIAYSAIDSARIEDLAVTSAKMANLSIGGIKVMPPVSGSMYLNSGQWADVYHYTGRRCLISIYKIVLHRPWNVGAYVSENKTIEISSEDNRFTFANFSSFSVLTGDPTSGYTYVEYWKCAATIYYTYS